MLLPQPSCPGCPPAWCWQQHPWLGPLFSGGGRAHAPAIYGFNFQAMMLQEALHSPGSCPALEGDGEQDVGVHRGMHPGDQRRQHRSPERGLSEDKLIRGCGSSTWHLTG